MSSCLLSNNTAIIGYGGISGGGASSCTLVSCTLVSNITDTPNFHPAAGGGAVDSTLINCSLTGNAGKDGGGAYNCKLRNCSILYNSVRDSGSGGGGVAVSTMTGCLVISNSAATVGGGCLDSIGTNCVISQNSSGYQGGAHAAAPSTILYSPGIPPPARLVAELRPIRAVPARRSGIAQWLETGPIMPGVEWIPACVEFHRHW